MTELDLRELRERALVDTGVWTWVRDRRFGQLAPWFNGEVIAGRVIVCELVVLELVRLAPNRQRARELHDRLSVFESVSMPQRLWPRARQLQLAIAEQRGAHRAVPPADLLIAAAAEASDSLLLHYDADYEAIARVSNLRHRWLVPRGTLA